MTVRHLDHLYRPGSIAVFGASDRPESIGGQIFASLSDGFSGTVRPVNPRHATVGGGTAYPDASALPETPDLAIYAAPIDGLLPAAEALAARGTKALTIVSDAKRGQMPAAEMRRALGRLSRAYDIRINGPNSLGFATPDLGLYATMSRLRPAPGPIAFVGQSATAAGPIADWAAGRDLGFSYLVSLGDMVDVDYADLLYFLGADARTRVIVLFVERMRDARRFLSAAREAARAKPVIVMKPLSPTDYTGTEEDEAVLGGTSRDQVYAAAFRRAGLIRVRTLEDMFDAVEALAVRLPVDVAPGRGDRLAILANGESMAALAQDALVLRGKRPAALSPETADALQAVLPPGRRRRNPVDILADADADRYAAALEVLMRDKRIDALLVLSGSTGFTPATATAEAVVSKVSEARRRGGRRPWVLTSWPGGSHALEARRLFAKAKIPTFATPSIAVSAFAFLTDHRRAQESLQATPASLPEAFDVDTAAARAIVYEVLAEEGAAGKGRDAVPEPSRARALLAAYGIDVDDADAPAGTGAPGEAAALSLRVHLYPDVEFGPVIRLGLGGPHGHLIHGGAVGLPPLNEALARDTIAAADLERFCGHAGNGDLAEDEAVVGDGAGGREDEAAPPTRPEARDEARDGAHEGARETVTAVSGGIWSGIDGRALSLLLMRVSQLAIDCPEILHLELNPVISRRGGARAGAARIVLRALPEGPEARRREPAIRPYPKELEREVNLRDGQKRLVRPIRPEDEPALQRLFAKLSPEAIRMRFFRPMRELDHDMAARLTQVDYDRQMAFVLTDPAPPGKADLYAVGRLIRDAGGAKGEYSIIVRSDLQHLGLGRLMMETLVAYARSVGLDEMFGTVLAENTAMLALNRRMGFRLTQEKDDASVIRVTLPLKEMTGDGSETQEKAKR